jgi:ATP-dependent protease ClpP protease subunit
MKFLLIISMIFGLQFANAKSDDILLTNNNHCSLNGGVDGKSMQKLKFCLADKVVKRRGGRYPIYLVINSPGGSVYAGLRFIEFAKGIRNLETVTIFAASMGSAIVEALPGKRHGTANAITMFHRAKGTFRGQFGNGEVVSQLKLWKSIVLGMEITSSNRIGITLKDYKKKVVNEYSVYGKDNVTQNTLDVISQVRCSFQLMKVKRVVKVRTLFGTSKKTVSDCPLFN